VALQKSPAVTDRSRWSRSVSTPNQPPSNPPPSTAQSSHHPFSHSVINWTLFPFSCYHKRKSTCNVVAPQLQPISSLCHRGCQPPTSPHLPTSWPFAQPLVLCALTCEQREMKEHRDQHGWEGSARTGEVNSRVLLPPPPPSCFSGGCFRAELHIISVRPENAHRRCFMRQTYPWPPGSAKYKLVVFCIWLSVQLDLSQVHKYTHYKNHGVQQEKAQELEREIDV